MKKISIITAFFNEQDNLPLFRQRLCAVLDGLDCDSEVVLVDDHSSDDSADVASQWCDEDDRIGYVRLSRNCGSHAAFTAGLAQCTGDCAILLAADLQDPPETIPQLVEQWRDGNHVVWAARSGRESEAWSTTAFAGVYYRVMRTLALPEAVAYWSLSTLREKLIKIGAKVVRHGRYITFQMAKIAIPRSQFAEILRLIDGLQPAPLPP